jgi:hypothetical protein
MASTLPEEVFLSHSNDDRDFVDSLANMVWGHGVPVWYSQTNIIGAQQWHDEIGRRSVDMIGSSSFCLRNQSIQNG